AVPEQRRAGLEQPFVPDRARLAADQDRAAPGQDAAAAERAATRQTGAELLEQPIEAGLARRVLQAADAAQDLPERAATDPGRRREGGVGIQDEEAGGVDPRMDGEPRGGAPLVLGAPRGVRARLLGESWRVQRGAAAQPAAREHRLDVARVLEPGLPRRLQG